MTTHYPNHGGGKYAKTTGSNRKSEERYNARALEYAKMMSSSKAPDGALHKPGSRKKVGG